ncbi:MAG: substrate-binding domain-containing protein, partial [Chloroflexota bacterium]
YKRVALVRGPEGHPYAQERYYAFLDALQEKGLSPNPALISPPMSWEKGAEAMGVLLDQRQLKPGLDFQAVVAASDLLAIGVLNKLVERGIRVPTDVAVAGFNDIEEGRLVRPPLTSVSLPFYEQGHQAVEALLDTLAGHPVPERAMLQSRLLVRQSCGCPSESVNLAAAQLTGSPTRDPETAFKRGQEQLMGQIVRVISKKGIAAMWAKQLMDAFRSEINAGEPGQFRATLDSMLQRGVLDGDETAAWQGVISVLRREILPALTIELQMRAEDLFGQARVVIGEAIQRAQIARQLQAERQNQALRDIGQALITTFEVDKLVDVLAARLPELGIESCYLALFENPSASMEWSTLILAYTEGRRADLNAFDCRFPSRRLVPPGLLPDRRYSLLVEPLYFQTDPIGFVVFEIGPRDGAIYEVLRGHISSALKGALLFQEAYEARLAAERADQIKTRLLANVSHELRTPLNIIIGHAQRLLVSPPPDLTNDLEQIQHSAQHQLRIINDLLDLSRAEINALDLYPERLSPKALIEEVFAAFSKDAAASAYVVWRLELPDQLPEIEADPVRLRQILLNLLGNAGKFTEQGQITLGAAPAPPHLHMWVADTGPGISAELQERIYEPFFTATRPDRPVGGIGLGLSITKHLVALHQGLLRLDSRPGQGSAFHIYLPLPAPKEQPAPASQAAGAVLWLISNAGAPPLEVIDFCHNQNLTMRQVDLAVEPDTMLAAGIPAVIVWDITNAVPADWQLIRRLHNHPQLNQTPFILYQHKAGDVSASGFTSLVVKPASSQALWEAIRPTVPRQASGSVLIVDDDPHARQLTCEAVSKGLPDYTLRTAADGEAGLAVMLADPPSLVILDLMMPGLDGFEVLDRMRADERTRRVPVVILSGRQL